MCGLNGHDLCIGCNTDDADPVVTLRRDNTRHVCAVAVIVLGVTVMIKSAAYDVSTVDVVHKTVVVVVDAVVGNLARVNPHVPCKVLVVVIDTRVNHSNNDVAVTPGRVPVVVEPLPCFFGACACQRPLVRFLRIISNNVCGLDRRTIRWLRLLTKQSHYVVGFNHLDPRVERQLLDGRIKIDALGHR